MICGATFFFFANYAYVAEAILSRLYKRYQNIPLPGEREKLSVYSPQNAIFQVRKQNTPLIQSVSPTSFSPGPESIIALGGMIFTDRYGTNVAASSNGKEETVNRVYAGPLTCELRKTNDELYVS